ncbi:MAG: UDP-N-acetylmuramate--L-alanine ligase, partial [Vicinamibacterales bacterium]
IDARRATPCRVVRPQDALVPAIVEVARAGDMVITLGAGSIGAVARGVVPALEARWGPGEAA